MKNYIIAVLVALSAFLGYNAIGKEEPVSHYLALVFWSMADQAPPELIAPFKSADQCEHARKQFIEQNKEDLAKFNGDAEFVCLKILKGKES